MRQEPTPAADPSHFIGIDSDGTVFDTMPIKHQRVFQPLAVEIWGLEADREQFDSIAEYINLYSAHRGINRYQGLGMAFEQLAQQSENARAALAGYEDLLDFIHSGNRLSTPALESFNASRQSPFLDRVLQWSERSDALYSQIVGQEGSHPFPRVLEILTRASRHAELMVVSSSSREVLLREWADAGLLPLTTRVAGQEVGSKTVQLESATQGGRCATQAIMIGDAIGDLEAAQAHGILFYPIIPGQESQSWHRFETEALERFFQGTYAGAYEESLQDEFLKVLCSQHPVALSS